MIYLLGVLLAATASFRAPIRVRLPQNLRPLALAVADFNGDGHADIAVAGESQQLITILGDGKGSFRLGPVSAAGVQPSALAVADLDGDGKQDIVVANHDTNHLTILTGAGNGRFTAREIVVHSNPHPHMVAAADFDGDRRPDIVVDSWMENRLLLHSSRDRWRGPGTPIEIGRKPYWNCVAADLNGDGRIDLIVPNVGSGTVSILLGSGTGQFRHAPGSPLEAGPNPFSVATGDVDGDGDLDVVVANYSGHAGMTANDGLTWIRNDRNGRFCAMTRRVAPGQYSARLAAGDVNGDGYADVAFTNTNADFVTIVFGSASGPRDTATVKTMTGPHSVALQDLNHDRKADLIVAAENSGELLIILAR